MSPKKELYRKTFSESDFPGYAAIQESERLIYGHQEPVHWATIIPYELGGKDPLWATDCFKSQQQQDHFHYISLGFTNLYYDEDWAEDEVSGFGFELTFRHLPVSEDPEKPVWPANLFQNLARYVFKSGNRFGEGHYMSANGPLRFGSTTAITAMAFDTDPELNTIMTPHGEVTFLQIFGITTQEYQDLRVDKYTVRQLLAKHQKTNPLLITDLNRGG
jgi:hypothetical protein